MDVLRDRTRSLHTIAERSGFVGDLLRGHVKREAYILFLRNLWPVYLTLEQGLVGHARHPAFEGIVREELFRSASIGADLDNLCGNGWEQSIPILPAAVRYVDAVAGASSQGNGERLLAHAYTRYLGDLNGGQVLSKLLTRSLGLTPPALTFYEFAGIRDLKAYRAEFRRALDAAGHAIADRQSVICEAELAFGLNINLSEEVKAVSASPAVKSAST